jgi:iron complex transport system substrate-binding protein
VCAVSEGTVCSLGSVLDPAPQILSMSSATLDGVWGDVRLIAAAIGRRDEAETLLERLVARMRAVHETLKAARAPRPRVAVIEWLDPLFVAGHWTPELVRRAGGIDVLAEPGAHSVRVDVGRIREAAPELLLFAPCGFDVARAAKESLALLASPEWRWARGIDAWALDGNALTSRPGPRLVDAVETMAGIFAPGLLPLPSAHYARRLL